MVLELEHRNFIDMFIRYLPETNLISRLQYIREHHTTARWSNKRNSTLQEGSRHSRVDIEGAVDGERELRFSPSLDS
jgi:hypothetical protein